jgi:uncharacterized membrane protein
MNGAIKTCAALGLGAGLMYYLDPNAGRRRRARLKDAATGALHDGERFLESAKHDLNNRAHGMLAETQAAFRLEQVADEIIAERVRAGLGRLVTHSHSINVTVHDARVTLTGPILSTEIKPLIRAVWGIRGVSEVVDRLEPHEDAADVPGLQGSELKTGRKPEILQSNWAPGPRLMACLAGCGLAAYGARKSGPIAKLLGTAGLGLMARGITNAELDRLVGRNGGAAPITVEKTIKIKAPPDEVFRFWSDYRNFPRFMSHVLEVCDLGDGKSHWVVDGPAGTKTYWDAEVTELTPNEQICWKTMENHGVSHCGSIQFSPNQNGGTLVHLKMQYTPPLGIFGNTLARIFGADPKTEMEQDLARMKTMIETGHPARDAALNKTSVMQNMRL